MSTSQDDSPDISDTPPAAAEPAQTEAQLVKATPGTRGALLAVRVLKGLVTLMVLGGVALSLWPHPRAIAPPVVPPSLSALNASLNLSEGFLRPLNHVFSANQGVTSEYYGIPVRLRFGGEKWMYPGQENAKVGRAFKAPEVEGENIQFHDGPSSAEVRLRVYWDSAHWDPFRLTIESRNSPPADLCSETERATGRCLQRSHRTGPDIVAYASLTARLPGNQRATATLGDWTLSAGGQGRTRWFRLVTPRSNRAAFASWRYSIRHATANMREFSRYRQQSVTAGALGDTMRAAGFRPGQDIYAPLWGAGTKYGDGMPYRPSSYHDCNARQPTIHGFYPYRSKVCRLPLSGYRWLSNSDTLVRALQAVHVMNRHHDPNYSYSDLDHYDLTPAKTARDLERTWVPAGIPQCTPAGCEQQWMSAVRTASFGTLETILGYQYGDRESRAWADNAARALLRVQIGPDGWMQVRDRRYYRPLNIGSFYTVWDADFHNNQSFSFLMQLLRRRLLNPLDMPAEFTGIIPSNTESTMAVYAFLARYRCQRYGQGCGPGDVFGPRPLPLP